LALESELLGGLDGGDEQWQTTRRYKLTSWRTSGAVLTRALAAESQSFGRQS
jgi:hypothetical protein